MKRNQLHKELGLKEKRIPFSTPEGYFDNFSNDLLANIEKLDHEEKKKGKVIFLNPWIKRIASIVAVILIIFIPARIVLNNSLSSGTESVFAESDYFDFIDDRQLYELLSNEEEFKTGLDQGTIEEAVLASISDYELYSMR